MNNLWSNDPFSVFLPVRSQSGVSESPSNCSLKDTEEQLRKVMVKQMQQIAEINQKNSSEAREFWKTGIWYCVDLFGSLTEAGQKELLKDFQSDNQYLAGIAPFSHFDRMVDENGYAAQNHFIAKKNVKASEAMDAVLSGLTVIDCGAACQLARYATIREVLGDEKFNQIFNENAPINIGYDIDDVRQPILPFIDYCDKSNDEKNVGKRFDRPVKLGELVFLKGVPEGSFKKPLGVWNAFNVICSDPTPGNQKFVGMGLDPAGESELDIYRKMIKNHNLEEDPFKWIDPLTRPAYEEAYPYARMLKDHTSKSVEAFQAGSQQFFNIRLIHKLKQTPLENVSMDFVRRSL